MHKITVWKVRYRNPDLSVVWHASPGMWAGKCSCGEKTQYWDWGATMGNMLYHWHTKHREEELIKTFLKLGEGSGSYSLFKEWIDKATEEMINVYRDWQ